MCEDVLTVFGREKVCRIKNRSKRGSWDAPCLDAGIKMYSVPPG